MSQRMTLVCVQLDYSRVNELDLKDKERPYDLKKFEDAESQALLEKTLRKLNDKWQRG